MNSVLVSVLAKMVTGESGSLGFVNYLVISVWNNFLQCPEYLASFYKNVDIVKFSLNCDDVGCE